MVASDAAVPNSRVHKIAAGQYERKSSQKRMYSTISNLVSQVRPDIAYPKPAGVNYMEDGKIVNAALLDHVEKLIKSDRPASPITARDTTYHSTLTRTEVEDFKLKEKKPEGPPKIVAPPAEFRPEALKRHPYEVLSRFPC